jgi:agmatinase
MSEVAAKVSPTLAPTQPRLLRVPYEEGAYWRKGMRDGADAIMAQFRRTRDFSLASNRRLPYDRNTLEFPAPTIRPFAREASIGAIEASVSAVLCEGFAPFLLGGDHSITLPAVRSLANHFGSRTFSVLHFDAHSDTFGPIDGFDQHHGAVFRNIVEEGLVRGQDIHQFGLRGAVRDDGLTFAAAAGISRVNAGEFQAQGCNIAHFCPELRQPVYVSLDIDVVDPAFAPGTGTPVPGGLTSTEILHVVHQLAGHEVIGMDLVEVAPVYDVADITSLLAAHILLEALVAAPFFRRRSPC